MSKDLKQLFVHNVANCVVILDCCTVSAFHHLDQVVYPWIRNCGAANEEINSFFVSLYVRLSFLSIDETRSKEKEKEKVRKEEKERKQTLKPL